MSSHNRRLTASESKGLRTARELESHLAWLDTITPAALGVLAVASGIYTYLGVSSLLEDTGAMSFFAAVAYSVAVSVGIFVFWSYILRLLPSMRSTSGFLGLTLSMLVGSLAIIAMSSWLNAAALAGSAAVEQHLAKTVQDYQAALEQAHDIALSGQALGRDVERTRRTFEELSDREAREGGTTGVAGEGAVSRLLAQTADRLRGLEEIIEAQEPLIEDAYDEGNRLLGQMRALTVAPGPVEQRSVAFSEESVRLAGVIASLNQYSVASLVARAAADLPASIILPELDGSTPTMRATQSDSMRAVITSVESLSGSLTEAANEVLEMQPPQETAYNPISSADAVIRYAGSFVPSWAGAIAIDLLPGVLVFVLAVTQAAIRNGRDGLSIEETLTLADLKAAMNAMQDVEATMRISDSAILKRMQGDREPSDDGESPRAG